MSEDSKYVLLEKGKDFTLTALAAHLNSIHGAKKSGSLFCADDVKKYVERGRLPEYIGGHPIEEVSVEGMGLKMVRLKDK